LQLPIQTSLPKEIADAENRDHRFLARFRIEGDLNRPADEVIERERRIALPVYKPPTRILRHGSTVFVDEGLNIEPSVIVVVLCHWPRFSAKIVRRPTGEMAADILRVQYLNP
jgi:hypothetical protein